MDRRQTDRRASHVLLSDWRWAWRGRRRGGRRAGEVLESGVDWHHPWFLVLTLVVMALSTLDAIFTLELIARGVVREANPVMRFLMELDVQLFANFKVLLTGFAMLILVACNTNSVLRRVPVRGILHGILVFYVALIGYEVHLLGLS
ncbi:MAG: DUF5658 family protein [Gemmatimonadota bacterium]